MNKYIAECFGTLVLVLFGCGAAVLAGDHIGFVGISFAFGMAVLVMVYAIGSVSGCHINPAITFGMFLAGKISAREGAGYVIAQVIGAIIGAFLLATIAKGALGFDPNGAMNLGQNGFGVGYLDGFGVGAAFLTEVVFTAIFVFVVFGATSKRAHDTLAGTAIGMALFVIHLVTIPVTGTSVNPARSIGPAVVAGDTSQLWLFIVAPLIGSVIAYVLWRMVSSKE